MSVTELDLQNQLEGYSLHNLQGQFYVFQFLIIDLNSTKDSTFLKAVGIEFHIKGPKYLKGSIYLWN